MRMHGKNRRIQIIAVRKFIQQRVDYIVADAHCRNWLGFGLQEARDAGIPVILVDRMVDVEDETLYTAHVGSRLLPKKAPRPGMDGTQYGAGRPDGEYCAHPGTLGATPQLGRTSALENGIQKHSNWNLLAQLDGDFTQAKTYEVMRRYLEELPPEQDIDVVYCENDNEAFGAIEALEERGYVCGRNVDVICFDATRNALKLCMEGKIALAVECNPLQGPLVEEIIQTIEAGQMPQKQHYIKEQVFTAKNLTEQMIAEREY